MAKRRIITWMLLLVGGVLILASPQSAPFGAGLSLATAIVPLARAWKSARGTALKPAVLWSWIAWSLAMVAQAVAGPNRPNRGGLGAVIGRIWPPWRSWRPCSRSLTRSRPGGGAWAILMAVLVIVLLIPWLEATGFAPFRRPGIGLRWNTLGLGFLDCSRSRRRRTICRLGMGWRRCSCWRDLL